MKWPGNSLSTKQQLVRVACLSIISLSQIEKSETRDIQRQKNMEGEKTKRTVEYTLSH